MFSIHLKAKCLHKIIKHNGWYNFIFINNFLSKFLNYLKSKEKYQIF